MPTDEELNDYYSRVYRLDYQGVAGKPTTRHLQKRTLEANRRLKHVIEFLRPGSRTLDFGCGTGEFLTSLMSLGHNAYGFEPGHNYGHYARSLHGERVKIANWQQVSYGQPFDLVSCFHVLEHLKNPLAALAKMAEWTRPGGFVYIEVPDMGITDRNKGLGAFHFAHLIGFNHHNLLVAASLAGLVPKFIVSKTGIIFTHDQYGSERWDPAIEAKKGQQLTTSLYAKRRAFYNYFRYQLGKVFRRPMQENQA
jgi:SAM-dependent methyltransferase